MLAVAGCDVGAPVGPGAPLARDEAALIVSDPVSGPAAGLAGAVSSGLVTNRGRNETSVYVAAPSGLAPTAVAAEVENERTDASLRLSVVEGGFDPVLFEAATGDTLAVKFTLGDGGSTFIRATVPARRRPRVVRTQPVRGRTDVALNTVIRTVFSEPVDLASLTDSTVRLLQGNTALPGIVRAAEGMAFAAEFVPAEPLVPGTEYRIVLSEGIRDLSGDPLEAPAPIAFTTFGEPGTGAVTVTAVTSGDEPGGYTLWVDDAPGFHLDPNATVTFGNVSAGAHAIVLRGVGANCTVAGGIHQWVLVRDGSTAPVEFAVTCLPLPSLVLTVVTIGEEIDPDGYQVLLNEAPAGQVPANGSITLPLDLGIVSVTLAGVSPNCSQPDPASLAVEPSPVAEIIVERTIVCARSFQPQGRIAFSGWETVAGELRAAIYVANADGTGRVRITNVPERDMAPSWSPDGNRIVFARETEPGVSDLHVVDADGSNPVKLTEGAVAYDPAWSPDGRRIAFVSWRGTAAEIRVMDLDGGSGPSLRISPPDQGQYFEPVWSPSGTQVAFVGTVPGRDVFDLYVADADGGTMRRHEHVDASGSGVDAYGSYFSPAWLSDGQTIAVNQCIWGAWSYGCDGIGYIAVHPDDREVVILAENLRGAVWSSDGTTIAYEANGTIRFIRPDGQRGGVVIENAVEPAWRP
jgi:hypothetical protein